MSAGDFVKLSGVMGFSKCVKKHLARKVKSRNERSIGKCSVHCRNEDDH